MADLGKAEVLQRSDGTTFMWRLEASNGQIIASDAGQGYVDESQAQEMMVKILSGKYAPLVGQPTPVQDPGVDKLVEILTEALSSYQIDEQGATRAAQLIRDRLWPREVEKN